MLKDSFIKIKPRQENLAEAFVFEHYKLFLLMVEAFAPLQLVVSKCALTGKKASLYTREPLAVTVCLSVTLL